MKVLLLGADGFVGRHVAYHLAAKGHDVLCCARRTSRLAAMGFDPLKIDLLGSQAANPAYWRRHMDGVTHVVNCAGLLTGSDRQMKAVHVGAPTALYAALGGRPAVLLSAVGIDASQTRFAAYRRQGERAALDAGVTVLRAGLILGDTSWGGSSLMRALAAFPMVTPVVGTGTQPMNPIHATDLAGQIEHLLHKPMGAVCLETAGPETLTQSDALQQYRAWLGLRRVPVLRIPRPVAVIVGRIGDAMRLGPISATAVAQLDAGIIARPDPRLPPVRGFSTFHRSRPPGTQDLWHARLFLARPLIRVALAMIWLLSGLIGLGIAVDPSPTLVDQTGLGRAAFTSLALAGSLADLTIAAAVLRGWRPRLMVGVQAAMIAGYTVSLTLLAPALWLLPFGGVLKNLGLLGLLAVLFVLEDDR